MLSPDRSCGNRVFKMNTEFCYHLYRSSFVIFFLGGGNTIFLKARRSLSLNFGFRPQFLADDVFPLCVCVPLQPWILLLWIHLTKWPFWLEMFQLNAHQQSVLSENLTKSPSLKYCHTNCYLKTLSNASKLALHSVKRQRNNERYN